VGRVTDDEILLALFKRMLLDPSVRLNWGGDEVLSPPSELILDWVWHITDDEFRVVRANAYEHAYIA
jgi:hypothetical protein